MSNVPPTWKHVHGIIVASHGIYQPLDIHYITKLFRAVAVHSSVINGRYVTVRLLTVDGTVIAENRLRNC